jgi:hypothetical protein
MHCIRARQQLPQESNRCLLHILLQGAMSLSRQAGYFREYQSRVGASAGEQRARELTSGSIYVVSAGTSDYVQNYYVNPVLSAAYTPDQFADALMQPFTSFVEVHTCSCLPLSSSQI